MIRILIYCGSEALLEEVSRLLPVQERRIFLNKDNMLLSSSDSEHAVKGKERDQRSGIKSR